MGDGSLRTRVRKLENEVGMDPDEPYIVFAISSVGTNEEERWALYKDGRKVRLDAGTGKGFFDVAHPANRGDAR